MRRPLAVLWAALLVLVLGAIAAPPASADTAFPPGQYLWAATAGQVLVFDADHGSFVAQHDSQANGNMSTVNSQTGKLVVVPTLTGIDAFDANTGGGLSYDGTAGGYRQVAAIPSWASVGSPIIYGLRSDGTAVDLFAGGPTGPTGSIALSGPATYMSEARPVLRDQIIVNVKDNAKPDTYSLAVINTHDNSIRYLTVGSNQLVNGIVWSPDGSHAYLSSTNPDGSGGYVGTYTASTSSFTRAPLAANQAPKQLVISPDGSQLFVATIDTLSGQGTYQVVDTTTLSTVGSVILGQWIHFGYGDVGPDGRLWMPPGSQGQFGALQVGTTRDGGSSQFTLLGDAPLPFLSTLVVQLPQQFAFISGFDQKTYPGLTFGTSPKVVVLDGGGRPIADQQVTFTFDNNNATYSGWGSQALIVTDAKGEANTPPIVAGPNPGPVTVIATVAAVKPITLPMTIEAPAVPPSVTALAAGDGKVTVTFNPGDGHGISPTSFTVTAYDSITKQPAGVTATGQASPIPVTGLTNGKSYTFTVTANTPVGNWTSDMSQAINAGIAASITGTPPPGEVGKPYSFTYTVTGAPTPTVGFDNDATPLPAGLTFDVNTATISGTPTAAGSSYVSVTATNAVGSSEDDSTIVINPAGSLGGSQPTPSPSSTPSSSSTSSAPPSAGALLPPSSSTTPAQAVISSTSASDRLAFTGTPVERIVGAAAMLVVAGAVLLLLVRRRRTTATR